MPFSLLIEFVKEKSIQVAEKVKASWKEAIQSAKKLSELCVLVLPLFFGVVFFFLVVIVVCSCSCFSDKGVQ